MNTQDRPHISLSTENSTVIETFQNVTLRPILKKHNDLFLLFFKKYSLDKKVNLEQLEPNKLYIFIDNSLKKDLSFKAFIIGLVCGQFTIDEAQLYSKHLSECNKRIVSMVIERLRSQLS